MKSISSPVLFALLPLGIYAQEPVTVNTRVGPVIGRQTATLRTFSGIPYAAPPIGQLRWRPPQPIAPWTTPRDASTFGNVCTQVVVLDLPDHTKGQIRGAEDCLFLNIYAPPNVATDRPRPVMVWIHGGAFVFGAGSDYDGSVLAQKHGVVVITLNYRLGPLGFLALPNLNAETGDRSSGNYGLLDQQAALRWVRDNIASFGGDPGDVTIFGESAGGMSVCAQLASPPASELFHKAIIQSGLSASPGNSVTVDEASRRNLAYASKLGCPNGDLACLRGVDPSTVTRTAVPGKRPLGNLVWSPVYGGAVLPQPLATAFEQGAFPRVPILQGTNRDEGRFFISLASPEGKPMKVHEYWGATGLLVGATKTQRALLKYPYRNYGTPAAAFATVFTDAMFSCPALRLDAALSKYVPVYAFEFNDPQAVTVLKTPAGLPNLGAFHSSSLVYAFQTPLPGFAEPSQFNPAQRELSDAFSLAWATFAKTGNPTVPGQPGWQKFDAVRGNVQTFTPTSIAESTAFADEHKCAFWSQLGLK